MDREPPAIYIVRLFAQQIEQLGIAHGDQEIKAVVCIGHNQEQGCFPVPQCIQLQLVIGRDLPHLGNVKYRQPRPAAHKNRLRCFAGA